MAEQVMGAPKFEVVLTSGVVAANKSVFATFGTADKKKFQLEFSAACVPLAIAALASQLGALLSTLPENMHPPIQPIVVTGGQAAMRDNGALALILTLEGGAELPLEMPRASFAGMAQLFSELAQLADPQSRN